MKIILRPILHSELHSTPEPLLFSTQVNPADTENYAVMVEMTFVFSMIWSVCASVDEDGRKKIDSYLREIEGSFPNKVRAFTVAVLYLSSCGTRRAPLALRLHLT